MNILTFDIEEWFHILDHPDLKEQSKWDELEYRLEHNIDRIIELLNNKNQKATFFCLGWVAKKYPQIIRKIHDNDFEIASHSNSHQLVYQQSRKEFRDDLKKSIESIEDVIGVKCTSYRAPGFSIKEGNQWAFEELINQGLKIDCSIFPANRAHGGFSTFNKSEPCLINIDKNKIKEFPINVFTIFNMRFIFSGGGYFRLLPYKLINKLFKKSNYVMTYFHPRDFDYEQPVIPNLSLFRKFKSYVGLKYAFDKLDRLITDFEFIDLKEADQRVDWERISNIYL